LRKVKGKRGEREREWRKEGRERDENVH